MEPCCRVADNPADLLSRDCSSAKLLKKKADIRNELSSVPVVL